MMIDLVKFVHILAALGLLGMTGYVVISANSLFFRRKIFIFIGLALISGTILVYPKHYSFHTPWIQAAYVFLIIYSLALNFTPKNRLGLRIFYSILLCMLVVIAHDAVTKRTFF